MINSFEYQYVICWQIQGKIDHLNQLFDNLNKTWLQRKILYEQSLDLEVGMSEVNYSNGVYVFVLHLLFSGIILLQPFFGSLDLVRDNPSEPVPEGTFRRLLDFLVQNEDSKGRCTNNPDGVAVHPD